MRHPRSAGGVTALALWRLFDRVAPLGDLLDVSTLTLGGPGCLRVDFRLTGTGASGVRGFEVMQTSPRRRQLWHLGWWASHLDFALTTGVTSECKTIWLASRGSWRRRGGMMGRRPCRTRACQCRRHGDEALGGLVDRLGPCVRLGSDERGGCDVTGGSSTSTVMMCASEIGCYGGEIRSSEVSVERLVSNQDEAPRCGSRVRDQRAEAVCGTLRADTACGSKVRNKVGRADRVYVARCGRALGSVQLEMFKFLFVLEI